MPPQMGWTYVRTVHGGRSPLYLEIRQLQGLRLKKRCRGSVQQPRCRLRVYTDGILYGLQHLVSFGQPAQLGRHRGLDDGHTAKLDLHRLAMNQRLSQLFRRASLANRFILISA
jgi:hypothetical protein